uniref:Uncharacterized protein n=1 Tax=Vitis vinifera TaxID=29760 RepID=F6HT79_VITVI
MPKLDPYPFSSRSFSSESSTSGVPSMWCCKAGRKTRNIYLSELTQTTEAAYDVQCTDPHNRGQWDSTVSDLRGRNINPGIENHYTAATSASMGSTFLGFQKWSSCFQGGGGPYSSSTENSLRTRELADKSATSEMKKKKKKGVDVNLMNDGAFPNKKPLSERASEVAQPMPIVLVCNAEKPKDDGKFNWAAKYRPNVLSDFICHQEVAERLRLLIIEVLEFIAKCEGIELPPRLAENIAEKSKHSIQQAIRSFEATWQLK